MCNVKLTNTISHLKKKSDKGRHVVVVYKTMYGQLTSVRHLGYQVS